MSRKEKGGKKVIEHIEMDATILDIVLVDKNGRPSKRSMLFTATNVFDRRLGAGFTMEEAIESLRKSYDEQD